MTSTKTPEEYKELGNKAFAEKDFEVAIENYSKAIELDPKNHVFFSNRSASYAGLKNWERATEDAKECIRLDPQFMKGYYRLANAQLELEDYDMAVATIKKGLSLDANNSQLLKVLRDIKLAKKSKEKSVMSSERHLDHATSRELRDLQIQLAETSREYNKIKANLTKSQREQKMSEITLAELEKNPSTGCHFRSAGKVFIKQPREEIFSFLKTTMDRHDKSQTDLQQKIEFLERRLQSQQANVRELTSSG